MAKKFKRGDLIYVPAGCTVWWGNESAGTPITPGELVERPTYGACVEDQVDGELYIKAKLNNFTLGYVDIREIYPAGEEA